MKAYTDLEQSKKLTEILSEESADHFHIIGHLHTDGPRYEVIRPRYEVIRPRYEVSDTETYCPCWSLAALIDVLPFLTMFNSSEIGKSALTREEAIKYITPWLVDIARNKIYVTVE